MAIIDTKITVQHCSTDNKENKTGKSDTHYQALPNFPIFYRQSSRRYTYPIYRKMQI